MVPQHTGERRSKIHEKDLSAAPATSQKETWISRSHEDQGRTGSSPPEAKEGPEAPHGMMETLTKRKDFARVFEEGQKVTYGPLRLFFYRREAGPARVCFVGRSKKAVCRNRIRRRLREAFRVYYHPIWKNKPFDLIFMGNEDIASVEFSSLVSWMGELLERVEQEG